MKTKLLKLLFVLPMLFATSNTFAQTTLAPGDIVIIQLQGDDPDSFAFVTFVDIAAGTGIYFTDCGVSSEQMDLELQHVQKELENILLQLEVWTPVIL